MNRALARLGALGCLAGLTGAAWLGMAAVGGDYFRFWLSAGPLIGLGFSAMGWAWAGVDRHAGLVSADPLDYLGSCLQAVGLPLLAISGHLRADSRVTRPTTLDLLLSLPLAVLLALGALGWLFLIAPAQYFLFLVFGAPARLIAGSRFRLHAGLVGHRLESRENPDALSPPPGFWDASLRDRPVAMTSAFMAAGLFLLSIAFPR